MKQHTPDPIKQLLFGLIKLTKHDMEKQFSKAGIKLSQLQYWVLTNLSSGPITVNEIAKKFGIKPPSLIPVVDALETVGYLHRKPDTKDRRKMQLIISKNGLSLLKKNPYNSKTDGLAQAFHSLPAHKQKQLIELLQELTAAFPA